MADTITYNGETIKKLVFNGAELDIGGEVEFGNVTISSTAISAGDTLTSGDMYIVYAD